MKIRAFPLPRLVQATCARARSVLRGFWFLVSTRKFLWLIVFIATMATGVGLMSFDKEVLADFHIWHGDDETFARRLSFLLGTWGDFPTYNLPLALLMWLYGAWRKKRVWRNLAIVCFLGSAIAGLVDDCLRLTLGRPRPDAHLPDGFYGLGYTFQSKYQSFPSGHAAAVFGCAAALLVVDLPLGLMATVFALLVCWARIELYRHYPSDVLVGSLLGIYCGLLVGFGSRVRLPNKWRQTPPNRG